MAKFSTIFPSVVDTGGKFAPGVTRYWRQICRRCQQRWWQIATGINDTGGKFNTSVNNTCGKQWEQLSNCWQLKMNLKKKIYIYVNSTTQSCPNKIIKIFLIEDFFHLPPVSTTPVVHLELRISPRIFEKKNEITLMVYLWALGKLIHEKNQKSKISWHCPFTVNTVNLT